MSSSEKCVDCNDLFWKQWDLIKNEGKTKKQNFIKKQLEILCKKCSDIKLMRETFSEPKTQKPKINIKGLERNFSWGANYPTKWKNY